MKPQPIIMQWPQHRLLKALKMVIDEQAFTPLRKRMMIKKLTKMADRGDLQVDNLDTEWLYRMCAASLMQHDYHWHAWEWRSKWASELATKIWAYPRWDGTQRRILVVAEQGVGDEIVFASCYNDMAQDVDEAWVEVDPRLVDIFTRSFPENLHFVDRFIDSKRRVVPRMSDYPEFHKDKPIEAFIMAGNVPKLYRHSPADFRKSAGFLRAEARYVQRWRDWLNYNLSRAGMARVGCSWKGRQGEILPIKSGLSLQYGEENHRGLLCPPLNLKRDLDEVFAIIKALGRVVTTTNAVAHMAGALGVMTDCIKPPPIFATREDTFNNRVTPWWPVDYTDWYPSIRMWRSQREWEFRPLG